MKKPSIPVPPPVLRLGLGSFDDPALYTSTGKQGLEYLVDFGGLKAHENVLDLGCGCGRIAVHLADFLTSGTYNGLDISRPWIDWCRENIASVRPNFHFQLADVFNRAYNPEGKGDSQTYRFPYPDNTFDLVFAFSLHTHLLPDASINYLNETWRVLKPSGRMLISLFVLDDAGKTAVAQNQTDFPFKHNLNNGCWTLDPKVPEEGIAHEEPFLMGLLRKADLHPDPIHYGNWRSVRGIKAMQDIVVARKTV